MKNKDCNFPKYFQFDPLIQGWSIDGLYSNEENKKMSEIYLERIKPLELGEKFCDTSFYLHYDWKPFQIKILPHGRRIYFQELKPIESQDEEDGIFLKKAQSIISSYDLKVKAVKFFLSSRGESDFFKSFVSEDDFLYKRFEKNADDVKRLLIIEKHLLSRKKELLEWCDNAVLSLFDFHYINFNGNPKDFLSHLQSIADNKLTDSKHDQQLKKLIGNFIGTQSPTESVFTPPDGNHGKKEINITPKNAELIYTVLVPYFTGQETSLKQLLNGDSIEKPLDWSKNANQLTHIFWVAKRKGYISDTNVQICEWIIRNFRYNNGKEFGRTSVEKDLNTQETRCHKPLPNTDF